jgi:hypothetical protein
MVRSSQLVSSLVYKKGDNNGVSPPLFAVFQISPFLLLVCLVAISLLGDLDHLRLVASS